METYYHTQNYLPSPKVPFIRCEMALTVTSTNTNYLKTTTYTLDPADPGKVIKTMKKYSFRSKKTT